MRVVAGELGGRRLRAPRGRSVRPTSDRVREAVFAILGDVRGALVLDLFCGTGAMAIEAISRGAERATLVDLSTGTARHNVEALGLEARARLVSGDALAALAREPSRYDLVFIDPPYRLASRLGPKLDSLLPARLAAGGRVITESDARRPMALAMPLLDERVYGDSLVRIHSPEGRA